MIALRPQESFRYWGRYYPHDKLPPTLPSVGDCSAFRYSIESGAVSRDELAHNLEYNASSVIIKTKAGLPFAPHNFAFLSINGGEVYIIRAVVTEYSNSPAPVKPRATYRLVLDKIDNPWRIST